MMKKFIGLILLSLHSGLCAQNHIEIYSDNGELSVDYFPGVDDFTNPFYRVPVSADDKKYFIPDLTDVKNKVVAFVVNGKGIELYFGVNDSIKVLFDVKSKAFTIQGDNSEIHKNFNFLLEERMTIRPYQKLFDFKHSDRVVFDVLGELRSIILFEKEYICERLGKENTASDCYQTYATCFYISMLLWIEQGFPEHLEFKAYFSEIINMLKIQDRFIKKNSNGFTYYDIYYKTINGNKCQDPEARWLDRYKYLLAAPKDIRDYLLQCQYIGQYNTIRPYVNWCELYPELKNIFHKIYFPAFFANHDPCL